MLLQHETLQRCLLQGSRRHPALAGPPASFLPPNLFFFNFLLSFFFFSHKFGKKVTYFNYLSELREHLKYDQLSIPREVLR